MFPSALLADATPAERPVRVWWSVASAAALVRVLIAPFGGFPSDINTFKAWAAALAERGPTAFYGSGFADYLPGYLYVLWLLGEIHQRVRFSDPAFLFALKLPAVTADLLIGWVVFAWARRAGARHAVLLAAAYLFNPGVIFVSAYWGQVDAVAALLAVAGLAALRPSAPVAGTVLLTAGVLVKPQVAPAALLAAVYLVRALLWPRGGLRRCDLLLDAAASALATGTVLLVPFRLGPLRLRDVLQSSLGVYPYASVMAFNAWGALAGFWTPDSQRWLGMPYHAIGASATLVVVAMTAAWIWRHPAAQTTVMAAGVALLATFVLSTRIHERYLLYAIPCLAMAAAQDRRVAGLYAVLTLVLAANLLFAYTRPYLQTFVLPGWLEAAVCSAGATRLWSALGALTLPAALYVLFTWPKEASRSAA